MRGLFIIFIIQQKAWFVTKLFYENIFYAAEKILLIKHKKYYKINYNSIDFPNAVATFWQPLYTILRITMIHINKKRPDLGVFFDVEFFYAPCAPGSCRIQTKDAYASFFLIPGPFLACAVSSATGGWQLFGNLKYFCNVSIQL